MINGAAIRRYRKLLRLNQIAFAKQLGIAQPTLSQIESGRTGVSQEHIEALLARFFSAAFKPTFREFLAKLESESADQQQALSHVQDRLSLLTVWDWEDGFDLSHKLDGAAGVDVVTVRGGAAPAIAFRFSRKSANWEAGEIFVFETSPRDEIEDNDICLVQIRPPRSRSSKTLVALAHVVPGRRERVLQYEPLSPAGPFIRGEDESVIAVLKSIFRGRRLG